MHTREPLTPSAARTATQEQEFQLSQDLSKAAWGGGGGGVRSRGGLEVKEEGANLLFVLDSVLDALDSNLVPTGSVFGGGDDAIGALA